MTQLPEVDEHCREVSAPADRVWIALLGSLSHAFRHLGERAAAVWGLHPRDRSGQWQESVQVGDTLPGFAVAEVAAPRVLILRGGHRFAEYELRFELDCPAPSQTRLKARTYADFPGWSGTIYRALVIGSGGHRIAVRRMLTRVAERAERPRAV